ncbi:MAG: SpoVR family protein [Halobacteriovoraceae bacterium]|nr:SpoVR family protein [Halobacteriovoraceae bacterium]
MERSKPISGELLALKEEIEAYARGYGLDFYEVRFEVCDYDTISILAAQGGFPSRYPHWRFGMDYDQIHKGYKYGMSKIYEMVINTDPCYAYLLRANNLVDQKLVMAHVYGHADFFKHNSWFRSTNKKMMDVMANNGTKIRRYMEKYGQDRVEVFIDRVLSLENLLDMNVLFNSSESQRKKDEPKDLKDEKDDLDDRSHALKSFMRSKKRFEKSKREEEAVDPEAQDLLIKKEELKTRDIMKFLMENAPIEEWQSDIIGMLREEAYYFLPQRLTKIMNEGWASYWHSTMMTQNVLKSSEIIDFADKHAGVMAMGRQNINPYKIGIELFRDIEYRWNTGKFGKEYNDCEDMHKKENWNTHTNLGRNKIFEVRSTHNDITFIDEFFTPDFCNRMQLFTYKYNPRTGRNEIETRDFLDIKNKLLSQLTNFGSPIIEIDDDNYMNRGELLLKHVHQGVDLDLAQAGDTMRNMHAIWKRPVNLETTYDKKTVVYIYDGKEMKPRHTQ